MTRGYVYYLVFQIPRNNETQLKHERINPGLDKNEDVCHGIKEVKAFYSQQDKTIVTQISIPLIMYCFQ